VSVARFIADQRTNYRVPHTLTCALLGVSLSWFYKWLDRAPTGSERRRAQVDAAVAAAFTKARGLHGSRGWSMTCARPAGSCRRRRSRTRCAARA
jgi:putative transposase